MMKRRASPGYRDAFNFYSSGVPRERANCSLDSFSLHSSIEENQKLQSAISIEEDVLELNSQVQQLVVQVGVLAHGQATAEDSFTQFKQDSGTLAARIIILEEHIKEIETIGEENLVKEEKKSRVLVENKENEERIAKENYDARYQSMQNDLLAMVEEIRVLRLKEEMIQQQKKEMVDQFLHTKELLLKEQEEHQIFQNDIDVKAEEWMQERKLNSQFVQEMIKEVNWLREEQPDPARPCKQTGHVGRLEAVSDLSARLGEMQAEIRKLREENRSFRESNEELEVALLSRGLEEGRHLLTTQHNSNTDYKIKIMGEDEIRMSLSEQKDANVHLQTYIDNVLLNIMERYPDLLEIRNK